MKLLRYLKLLGRLQMLVSCCPGFNQVVPLTWPLPGDQWACPGMTDHVTVFTAFSLAQVAWFCSNSTHEASMKQAWSKHEASMKQASISTSKDKALWLDAFKVCIDGLRQKAWCIEQSHFLELFIQENNLSICSLRVPRLYRNNGRLDQLERKTFARV